MQAELVTSDGKVLVANRFQHPDLFWALRGGGASTFGVVTRLVLMTHDLPETFGAVTGTIQATGDQEFQELLARFCRFYREKLHGEHWGEQVVFTPQNSLEIAMTFQGLTQAEVQTLWADWPGVSVLTIPARKMWDPEFWKSQHPENIIPDPEDPRRYWWAGNQGEVGKSWYTYQSRWIPFAALSEPDFLYRASRHWPVGLHLNKGLSGAAAEALQREAETSVNPKALEAAGLAILSSGIIGTPDPQEAAANIARVDQAMNILKEACPGAGSYVNEADYFEENWQREFWGVHYPRLLSIKRRYDPIGLFHCHHGVGSEGWSEDGMDWSPVG
jgi:hypothetical protein